MNKYVVDASQFYKASYKEFQRNSQNDFKCRFIIGKMTKIRPVLKVWKADESELHVCVLRV